MILSMCKDRILKIVEKHEDADFVYVNDLGRHRVNIYFQQGYMTAAIRIINEQIKTLEELIYLMFYINWLYFLEDLF